MKYYILEIQNNNENYAHLVHTADTRLQAESVYHQVLASAAISTLTSHAAVLFTSEGVMIAHQNYIHAEEPTPDEQPVE